MNEQHDLAKWLEGTMTERERLAFERTPEFADYDKIRKYSAMLKAPDFDTEAMYQQVVNKPKTKVIAIKPNWFLRIAAVLVIGLGLFFGTQTLMTQTETAANGATQIFQLPDASQVTLNSGSAIEYNKWSWASHRSLELDGEAFFKVTKGQTFDVCTELGKVTVVGTQFNVKARDKRFEVTCFEGKVRVESGKTITLLTPGMSIAFENGAPITAIDTDNPQPSWMQEQITFNAEDLDAVIAELERQYDIAITKQNITTNEKFTGTIPANNLDMALEIIGTAYNFKHNKTGKNSITFIGK